ncbi:MAG: DNA primase [Spirochaetia bacterium]|nr:DNA primase [Spirochaetia bacterium]
MAGDVDKLLNAIPIESYIQKYIALKKKGRNYWGLCPFHKEKTPSFSVSSEKGIYKCFGCGKGGNLITFVQDYEKVSFVEALKTLSEYSGIALTKTKEKAAYEKDKFDGFFYVNEKVKNLYQKELNSSAAFQYLKERNISDEAVKKFQLGFAPSDNNYFTNKISQISSNDYKEPFLLDILEKVGIMVKNEKNNEKYNRFRERLIFPIENVNGQIIGFGGRLIAENIKAAKYINSPDSVVFHKQKNLYNLYYAKEFIRSEEQAILVEGYFDVIGLYEREIKNVVAPLGTAFTENQAFLLKRYTDKVIIFFDNDNAGIEASYKALLTARQTGLNARVLIAKRKNEKNDPFDLSRNLDKFDLLSLLDNAKEEISFIIWYFFSYKFNISIFDEKKKAILTFFEFLLTLKENWQRDEYIEKTSKAIEINSQSLKKDFNLFNKNQTKNIKSENLYLSEDKPIKNNSRTDKIEKEIIGILLKFPELWEKKELIQEILWQNEKNFLLFSFFRDRIKTGEAWDWQIIGNAVSVLPNELSSLLSGFIIELEPMLEDLSTAKAENPKDYLSKTLEKLVSLHKNNILSKEILVLKKELALKENTEDDDADDILLKLDLKLAQKKKISEAIQKNPY